MNDGGLPLALWSDRLDFARRGGSGADAGYWRSSLSPARLDAFHDGKRPLAAGRFLQTSGALVGFSILREPIAGGGRADRLSHGLDGGRDRDRGQRRRGVVPSHLSGRGAGARFCRGRAPPVWTVDAPCIGVAARGRAYRGHPCCEPDGAVSFSSRGRGAASFGARDVDRGHPLFYRLSAHDPGRRRTSRRLSAIFHHIAGVCRRGRHHGPCHGDSLHGLARRALPNDIWTSAQHQGRAVRHADLSRRHQLPRDPQPAPRQGSYREPSAGDRGNRGWNWTSRNSVRRRAGVVASGGGHGSRTAELGRSVGASPACLAASRKPRLCSNFRGAAECRGYGERVRIGHAHRRRRRLVGSPSSLRGARRRHRGIPGAFGAEPPVEAGRPALAAAAPRSCGLSRRDGR